MALEGYKQTRHCNTTSEPRPLGKARHRPVFVEYDPQEVVENLGNMLGVVSRRVANDLERFKEFIEVRGQETGAWRGEVERPGR
jgi:hypothetical protein